MEPQAKVAVAESRDLIRQGLMSGLEGEPGLTLVGEALSVRREGEVLCCLKKGYCNKNIANELFISEKTVKTHLGNIFKKLNVSNKDCDGDG